MKVFYVLIYSSLLALLAHTLQAQDLYLPPTTISLGKQQTIDTANYTITYSLRVKLNPQKDKFYEDIVALQIGKKYTHFYSLPLAQTDSVALAWRKAGKKVYRSHQEFAMREGIYRDLSARKLITTYRTISLGPILRYEEPLPTFLWSFDSEQKNILGYTCTKAKLSYRGRGYTAWFTSDIPLPFGPWTFADLPGLILEINDEKNEVSITAVGITADRKENIYYWDIPYQNTTRDKARKLAERIHKHPYQYFRSFMPNGMIGVDGIILNDSHSLIYNPIELE